MEEIFMQRCISLARLGAGNVAPNPMVGAVLVNDGRIIGEGYHKTYGEAHAEVNCIKDAERNGYTELISQSTLYVSLEPCAHFGKTPPCVDLILQNKIPEVVIGCGDTYTEVNGKGITKLQQAGVKTRIGVLEKECRELNKRFFTFHEKKRPYVILKWAETANGKIGYATGRRLMITDDVSQRLVHKWRSEEAAIMIGTNTALMDNPQLTNRYWSGRSPVRMVLDLNLRLSEELNLFKSDAQTIVVNYIKEEQKGFVRYLKIERDSYILPMIMEACYMNNIQSLFVEGGSTLIQSLVDENLWDEARVFRNKSMNIEGGVPAPRLASGMKVSDEMGWEMIVNDKP